MSFLRNFFGTHQQPSDEATSAIDVVTYVASLASDVRGIDPLLEPLREITSRLQPGQPLSERDQVSLAEVCRKLQTYLIKHDPVRHFDPDTLATKIAHRFPDPPPDQAAFWKELTTREEV